MKTRAIGLEIKSLSEAGKFAGYASTFGTVDLYRERVAVGAFADTLAKTADQGRHLPILWQHRNDEPIGQWDVLREDEHGLYGEGTLWLDEAPYARLAHRGMLGKTITGLSIGFYTVDDSFDETSRVRTLKAVDLREISVVTDPANDEARIDTIKAKLAAGEHITEREFGKILRERGFSRSDADAIADVGFMAWSRRETARPHATTGRMSDLVKALGSLSLPK